jgi:hypothetical protein
MSQLSNTPDGSSLLVMSVVALALAVFTVPAFFYAKGAASYVGLPGVLVALVASMMCSYGFLYCQRTPWWRKLLTLLLAAAALYLAINCVPRYASFAGEP